MTTRHTAIVIAGALSLACQATGPDGAGEPATISISPSTLAILVAGRTGLTATVSDRFGNSIDAPVSWRTTDASVVTVDAEGFVTGVAPGTAEVLAELGGV